MGRLLPGATAGETACLNGQHRPGSGGSAAVGPEPLHAITSVHTGHACGATQIIPFASAKTRPITGSSP
jgi:hypothetical protein